MSALITPLAPAPSSAAVPSRLAGFAPNWFAAVMGTGIVANAAMLLPVSAPLLTDAALGVWVLATVLLIGLVVVSAAHVRCHPDLAAGHHRSLTSVPFYGTVAMAFLTVGSGAELVGSRLIGGDAALVLDLVCWSLGTAGGLFCAVAIPYLIVTRHRPRLQDVSAAWLLAVVPPVVAASAGAGLLVHLPAGQLRLTVEVICAACFGVSVCLATVMIVLLWARVALHGLPAARAIPTLWLVLGPLGQSVTASGLLALHGGGHGARVVSIAYGVPVWGFAILWLCFAAAATLRTARSGLPFSLSWWSFTFPVGTVVTGTSVLAVTTGVDLFRWASVALFALLVLAWVVVAARTVAGALDRSLFA